MMRSSVDSLAINRMLSEADGASLASDSDSSKAKDKSNKKLSKEKEENKK